MSKRRPFRLRVVAWLSGWHLRQLEPGVWHVPQLGGVSGTMFGEIILGTEVIVGCTRDELAAIIAHEQGHIAGWHGLWATVAAGFPRGVRRRINHWQEHRADAYAARQGHAPGMLSYFRRRIPCDATDTHPSTNERIRRLQCHLDSRSQ